MVKSYMIMWQRDGDRCYLINVSNGLFKEIHNGD